MARSQRTPSREQSSVDPRKLPTNKRPARARTPTQSWYPADHCFSSAPPAARAELTRAELIRPRIPKAPPLPSALFSFLPEDEGRPSSCPPLPFRDLTPKANTNDEPRPPLKTERSRRHSTSHGRHTSSLHY